MLKRIIITAVLLAVIVMGGTGCMFNNLTKTEKTPNVNDQALAHMEEKYGEPFIYADATGNSMTGTRKFFATCESLPGKQVLVQINNYKEENKTFLDNYLAVKYEETVKDYFHGCAAEVFGEANVYYEAHILSVSSDLPAETSFEEFYADESTLIVVMIELKESSYSSRQQLEDMLAKIMNSQGEVLITTVVVEDALYGTLDRRSLNIMINNKEQVDSVYAKIKNGAMQVVWTKED